MTSLLVSAAKYTAVSVGGALISNGAMWLSRKVEERTGKSVGNLLYQVTSDKVASLLKSTSKFFIYPLTYTSKKMKDIYLIQPYALDKIDVKEFGNRGRFLDKFLNVGLAPLFEELTFRGLIQTCGGMALERLGIPSVIAQGTTILLANVLFALAHLENHEEINTETFSSLFSGGLVDSLVCKQFGIPASILGHVANNYYYSLPARQKSQ